MWHIFSKFCLRHSDVRTDKQIKDVVNTYPNVVFEDLFANVPTLAKIEFGQINECNETLKWLTSLPILEFWW